MQRMKRSAARDGAGAGGSNILRGGKNAYDSKAKLGNWVEEEAAAGIMGAAYTHPRFATTTRLSNEKGVGPGTKFSGGVKFGAGLVRPQQREVAADAWATTTQSLQSGAALPEFSSTYKMTGGIRSRKDLEAYRKRWTSDTSVMRKTRFVTEMNEALGGSVPQFKYRTLRSLPGQPKALERLRDRLAESAGTFCLRALRRAFTARDAGGYMELGEADFRAAVGEVGAAARDDLDACWARFQDQGAVDAAAFLGAMRGDMTDVRAEAVGAAWELLGGAPDAVVPTGALGSVGEQLAADGLATEGEVTFDEFFDYWHDVGATVVDDAQFVKMCGL